MQVGTGANDLACTVTLKVMSGKNTCGSIFDFKRPSQTIRDFICLAVRIQANRSGPQTVAALPIFT